MILLKKRIQLKSAFSAFILLSLSINLHAQQDPATETKLEERQILHQNLQNPNISEGLKDSLILIFKLHDELDQLVSKDEKMKDSADRFLFDHEAKILSVCPSFTFDKLYFIDRQTVSRFVELSPEEVDGYLHILNALIMNIQNN